MTRSVIGRTDATEFDWHRTGAMNEELVSGVQEIIQQVRCHGDAALRDYSARFDKVSLQEADSLRVPEAVLSEAWRGLDAALQSALQSAAQRIRHFHGLQRKGDIEHTGPEGDTLGLTWRPLNRVCVYVPGGRAAYPSTVLMNVIPAQVARVQSIVLASPPQADTGFPHALVLAAAHMLGVTEVYRVGGAQAIAAFTYGTESVPAVDKIVGPGNAYVAQAKRLVAGDVGIDSIAGPSEVFIVADETANPVYVAADLLAQAEHDPEAGAVCISTSPSLLGRIETELQRQLASLQRRQIAQQSLERWGALVLASTLDEAISIVNQCAPEHVELMLAEPEPWLNKVHTAGAVFLGHNTPESVGDYYAGTNHVLPTFGTARFASGLGVDDFVRRMSYVKYTAHTLVAHAADICLLANAEGLEAHGRAVEVRVNGRKHA